MILKSLTFLLIFFSLNQVILASECVVDSFEDCRNAANQATCNCPCLPKCCPKGQVLVEDNSVEFGIRCDHTQSKFQIKVNLTGNLSGLSAEKHKFYGGFFPSCKGIPTNQWKFDIVTDFELDADKEDEYILHIPNAINGSKKVTSNFNNQGERSVMSSVAGTPSRHKPLMYFCFDTLPTGSTVAVTCPSQTLNDNVTIAKCCPKGQAISKGKCIKNEDNWNIPINGFLINSQDLMQENKLVHDLDDFRSKLVTAGEEETVCPQNRHAKHAISDLFHLGPDGKLHFTDVHLNFQNATNEFCIDLNVPPTEDPNDYDTFGYHASSPDDAPYHDPNSDYQYEDSTLTYPSDSEPNTVEWCQNGYKINTIEIQYCANPTKFINKCCSKGENINLRGKSCTTHLAKKEFKFPMKTYEEVTIFDHHIVEMKKEFLSVVDYNETGLSDDFASYNHQGVNYSKDNFCIDYLNDYCLEEVKPVLSIIIHDKALAEATASGSIFYGAEDNAAPKIMLLKRIGFSISLFFLFLTLAIHIVDPVLMKELSSKMVIFLTLSMIGNYLCLLLKTFEATALTISKTSSGCITLALASYFFSLSTFAWMTSISYNIMTQFSGGARFPQTYHYRRLMLYGLFSFGLPLFLTALVGGLNSVDSANNPLEGVGNEKFWNPSWRPGLGEESCWFSHCSKGLLIFFCSPVGISLVANVMMFIYAGYLLNNLQASRSFLRKQRGEEDSIKKDPRKSFKKKLSRQLSTAASSIKKQKDNIERFHSFAKIFGAMGITWIGEMIALLIAINTENGRIASIILSLPNIFQGLIIFLVFGLKKRRANMSAKRRQQLERQMSSSTSNRRASLSRQTSQTLALSRSSSRSSRVNSDPKGGMLSGPSVSFSPTRSEVCFKFPTTDS